MIFPFQYTGITQQKVTDQLDQSKSSRLASGKRLCMVTPYDLKLNETQNLFQKKFAMLKYFEKQWLGLPTPFNISMLFKIL